MRISDWSSDVCSSDLKKGAAGLKDYLLEVPNVSLQSSGNGSQKISMRGISNVNSSDLGYGDGSPTTGVYLNDVGIPGSGVFPDLAVFDLQRIEVLQPEERRVGNEGVSPCKARS